MSEQQMRQAFVRLSEPVVAGENPYGQIMARRRSRLRARVAGWVTGVLALAVAGLVGPGLLPGAAGPDPNPSISVSAPAPTVNPAPYGSFLPGSDSGFEITESLRLLLDSPTRGALAGDKTLIGELAQRLDERLNTHVPGGEMKILFAEDVGNTRVVLAVRRNETEHVGYWVVGARGESATQLAAISPETRKDGAVMTASLLLPFETLRVSNGQYPLDDLRIGVAPAGCAVEATRQDSAGWFAEPTAGYLIRVGLTPPLEYRVTCAGVELAGGSTFGHDIVQGNEPNDAEIDALLAGVDCPYRRELKQMLDNMENREGLRMRFCGSDPIDGEAVIMMFRPMPSGEQFEFQFGYGSPLWVHGSDPSGVFTPELIVLYKPNSIAALRRQQERADGKTPSVVGPEPEVPPFLIIPPAAATVVQALDVDGTVLAQVSVSNGIVRLAGTDAVKTFRALDRSGTTLASMTNLY